MAKSAAKSAKKARSAGGDGHQVREASAEGVEATQAREAGAKFDWHYGRVTRLGNFQIAGGREVVIVWEEGGVLLAAGWYQRRGVGDLQAGVHDDGSDRHSGRRTRGGLEVRFPLPRSGAVSLPASAASVPAAPLLRPHTET